ncbi:MAG TPA: lytic transglycosylase domain-containing protein [Vicinamibacterales bacterium]|nr:lytic transglycosylase domain-containing protein [Vicinamibacterales bacterium]
MSPGRQAARRALLALLTLQAAAGVASAELVFLASGRTLSVKAHRVEGDSLVLTLRSGGEIVCAASLVDRIAPDEMPYPEPEPEPAASRPVAAVPFTEIINQAAAREGVDARLVDAVIRVESGYRANARSPKGAMGLMQLMPGTAQRYAVRDPYNPSDNINAGTRHLRSLLDRFDLALALAAYNAGEAAVERFGGIPPYAETQDYVRRILRLLQPGSR